MGNGITSIRRRESTCSGSVPESSRRLASRRRAEAVDRVELPPGWRELKSATAEKIPYYWNIETGDVRWERPRNDALIVARVVPATAPS